MFIAISVSPECGISQWSPDVHALLDDCHFGFLNNGTNSKVLVIKENDKRSGGSIQPEIHLNGDHHWHRCMAILHGRPELVLANRINGLLIQSLTQ